MFFLLYSWGAPRNLCPLYLLILAIHSVVFVGFHLEEKIILPGVYKNIFFIYFWVVFTTMFSRTLAFSACYCNNLSKPKMFSRRKTKHYFLDIRPKNGCIFICVFEIVAALAAVNYCSCSGYWRYLKRIAGDLGSISFFGPGLWSSKINTISHFMLQFTI